MSLDHESYQNDQHPIFEEVADTTTHLYTLSPSQSDIFRLTQDLKRLSDDGQGESLSLTILSSESSIESASERLDTGLLLADLVSDGVVNINIVEGVPDRFFVGEESTYVFTDVGGNSISHESSNADVGSVREDIQKLTDSTEEYELRLPSLTQVRLEMEDRFDKGFLEDFDQVFNQLSVLETDYSNSYVLLLIAALNEELLYDISRVGEDLGIASAATFSRTKSKLEDEGVIKTQKVPIDVGRPRQKILFTEEYQERLDSPTDIISIL